MATASGILVFRAVRDLLYQRGWYMVQREDAANDVQIQLTIRPWDPEPGGDHEDPA